MFRGTLQRCFQVTFRNVKKGQGKMATAIGFKAFPKEFSLFDVGINVFPAVKSSKLPELFVEMKTT